MGNSGFSLKRFLSNKNTVTIIAVMIGVVVSLIICVLNKQLNLNQFRLQMLN